MTDIPDNAISYRIAAVVPCEDALDSRGVPWCVGHPTSQMHCATCIGDGKLTVVTDVEVELTITSGTDFYIDFEDDFQNAPAGKYWREVRP